MQTFVFVSVTRTFLAYQSPHGGNTGTQTYKKAMAAKSPKTIQARFDVFQFFKVNSKIGHPGKKLLKLPISTGNPGTDFMIIILPVPGFISVVRLAAFRLPCNRAAFPPGSPPGSIQFALFLFGKLFVRNKFFHFYLPDRNFCRKTHSGHIYYI